MDRRIEGPRPRRIWPRWVIFILCGLLWVYPPQSSRGQETLPRWYPLAGPAGRVSHLAGASDGDLYAVSITSVNRQNDQTQWRGTGNLNQSSALYRSNDGGATWQPATNDLPPGLFTALSVDAVCGDILAGLLSADVAVERRSPLWRSNDGGLHWASLSLPATSFPANDLIVRQITRDVAGRYLFLGATSGMSLPSATSTAATTMAGRGRRMRCCATSGSPATFWPI